MEIWQRKDGHGRMVTAFVCGHAPPRRVSPREAAERGWCASSAVAGRHFVCGKSAAGRDPRAEREEGCPGGMKVCLACEGVVGRFLKQAFDAKACREEFTGA